MKVEDRRRHPRIPLGVPVRVRLDGDDRPVTIELVEISLGGGSFRFDEASRPAPGAAHPDLGQRTAFGFVKGDRSICLARGWVVRVDDGGFAVQLERMNGAFRDFLGDVSGPTVIGHQAQATG